MQTFANPGNWNVVELSAVYDMLRRVNITLNNVRGERISVNDLTVTGCYDPAGSYDNNNNNKYIFYSAIAC